jgi:protein TonB
MMHRSRSGRLAGFKTVLALPVAVLVFLILSAFETGASSTSVMPEKSVGQPDTEFSKIIKGSGEVIQSNSASTIKELVPPPPPPPPPPADKNSKKPEANEEVKKSLPAEISAGKAEENPTSDTYVVVEEMPEFPGGEKALMDFIYSNITFPESAKERYIQGRVILKFVVTSEGKVDNISVLKSVDPALDAEAIRVVSLLPNWKPGRQKGKNVNVWYNVPVTFLLQEPDAPSAMLKKLNEELIRKYKSAI